MSNDSLLGKQLDEYRLEKLLGKGGMAAVYRAIDTRLKRFAAIKVITASFRTDSDYMHRFEREAQAIAHLDHTNIITLYRYGEADHLLYMAMQYIEGADLAAVIESYHVNGDFLEPDEVVRLTYEIGAALDYAHSKGVIHRDIKPSNIMINQEGRAIVVDFGLALLTEVGTHGQVFGSPRYIAPEQAISSAGAVPQSDQYSVGVMLFEMFTGQVPFDATDALDIAMKHLSEEPPRPCDLRPELSEAVEVVILKALAKDPHERYSTVTALADELKIAVEGKKDRAISTKPTHETIPEKVQLEMQENALPPFPASVTPAPLPTASPTPKAERSPTQTLMHPSQGSRRSVNQSLFIIGAGVIAIILVGLVLFSVLLLTGMRSNNTTLTPTVELSLVLSTVGSIVQIPTQTPISSTSTIEVPTTIPFFTLVPALPSGSIATAPTLGFIMLPTPISLTATLIPATLTTLPISNMVMLDIVWRGDDSLFVINRSSSDFSLTALRLVGDRGSLEGAEWGIGSLSPGSCVAVWKEQGNPRAAANNCSLVGHRVTRESRERFWRSGVDVYLNDQQIATCPSSPCSIQVVL